MPINNWAGTAGAPVTVYNIDSERRDIDVSKQIARLIPDATPLTVMLMRLKKDAISSVEHIWYESLPESRWTQVDNSAGYDDDDTAINVDDVSFFSAKDLVKCVRTGEVMYITDIDLDEKELTVVRGFGTTSAAAMDDGDWLVKLSPALEENSLAPSTRALQPRRNYNYVQTFRLPFDGSTDVELEKKKTNETERKRLTKDKAIEHRMDIERTILFGERHIDVSRQVGTMGGILSYIDGSNIYDAQGVLTEGAFEEFCEMGFAYGGGSKLLVCSPRVASVINQFANGKLQTQSGDKTYGCTIRTYLSIHGEVHIVVSKMLERQYANMGILLDMSNISLLPFKGGGFTKLRRNIQENDRDGWKDEFMTKCTLEVKLPETHAILTNAG